MGRDTSEMSTFGPDPHQNPTSREEKAKNPATLNCDYTIKVAERWIRDPNIVETTGTGEPLQGHHVAGQR